MIIPRNLLLFTCSADVDRCVSVFASELKSTNSML